jgi:hypothetical protein
MFILSWQMVYKKFNIKPNSINYSTLVNLRPYLSDTDPTSMVWLCNSLYSSYESEIKFNKNDDSFWLIAKKESESFHARIKRGEQFCIDESLEPIEDNETRIHFGLSNVFIPNEIMKRFKMFEIKEIYTLSSYRKEWSNDFSYNNIVSIGDTLCWVISYNSYFVKNEIILSFLDSVMFIFDILCENKLKSKL